MFSEKEIDEVGQRFNWDSRKLYEASLEFWYNENDLEKSNLYAAAQAKAIELEAFADWWQKDQPHRKKNVG